MMSEDIKKQAQERLGNVVSPSGETWKAAEEAGEMEESDPPKNDPLSNWLRSCLYRDCINEKMLSSSDRTLNGIRRRYEGDDPVWETSCDTLENLQELFGNCSGLVFRGHACASWDLHSSWVRFFKDCGVPVSEGDPVESVSNKIAPVGFDENVLEQLSPSLPTTMTSGQKFAFAQHYGYPTHLLDWTESLNVALFFAFEDAPKGSSGQVALFAMDIGKIYLQAYCREKDKDPSDVMPDEVQRWLRDQSGWLMDHWMFCRPGGFWDVRMSVQETVLAVQMHADTLDRHLKGSKALPGTLVKVSMPVSMRPEVMRYLAEKDVARDRLFPDLDAICAKARSMLTDRLLER